MICLVLSLGTIPLNIPLDSPFTLPFKINSCMKWLLSGLWFVLSKLHTTDNVSWLPMQQTILLWVDTCACRANKIDCGVVNEISLQE